MPSFRPLEALLAIPSSIVKSEIWDFGNFWSPTGEQENGKGRRGRASRSRSCPIPSISYFSLPWEGIKR